MKILVVEDDIHVGSMIVDVLTGQGHVVTLASDAEEALALLAHTRPDALLLDVALGELSGVDVLRTLRKSDQRLPVVVITGHATPPQLDEARRLGVTDIVEKPFLLKRLTEAIAAASR